jgi:hypothetical protein
MDDQQQREHTLEIARSLAGFRVEAVRHRPMPGGGGFLTLTLRWALDTTDVRDVPVKTATLAYTELGIWLEKDTGRPPPHPRQGDA